MKAKMDSKGIELTYQLSRSEYDRFLEMHKKYLDSGLRFDHHDGGDKEDSWIKAEEWLR